MVPITSSLVTRSRRWKRATGKSLSLALALFTLAAASAVLTDTPGSRVPAIPAPELTGEAWINVPKGTKMSLSNRKGRVTVVHFWTFGCINCKRNLAFYQQWRQQFATRGLEIIGIHTPETAEERNLTNVVRKVRELGISYPVLIDQQSENWKRWQQRCWPTVYLVDKQGRARFAWEGELEYQGAGGNAKLAALIESLLRE